MNIKNRIRKLEGEAAPQHSALCSCIKPFRFLLPGIVEGDDARAAETHCSTCEKEKPEPRRFTFRFNLKVVLAEGV